MKWVFSLIICLIPFISNAQEYTESVEKRTYFNGDTETVTRYIARFPGILSVIEDCSRNTKGFTKTKNIGEWELITNKTSPDGFIKRIRETCEDIDYHNHLRNIGITAIKKIYGTTLSQHSSTEFRVDKDGSVYTVCYSAELIRVTATKTVKVPFDAMKPSERFRCSFGSNYEIIIP